MSDEDRIARVARALCVADGQDPDVLISVGTDDVELNASGIAYRRTVRAPAWTTYASEARRMIAAVRAMGLLETGFAASRND